MELSTGLVIIGLIIGGIMVGRDLIHSAEIRRVISTVSDYNNAVATFLSKYNGLPGDMPRALDVFPADPNGCPPFIYAGNFNSRLSGTCNGNGNGVIMGYFNTNDCQSYGQVGCFEQLEMWEQLFLAQLTAFQPTYGSPNVRPDDVAGGSVPQIPLSSGAGIALYYGPAAFRGPAMAGYQWTLASRSAGQLLENPGLSPNDAHSIDAKIDDGVAGTGSVIGWSHNWAYANCTQGSTYLVTDGLALSNTSGGDGCAMYIQAGF